MGPLMLLLLENGATKGGAGFKAAVSDFLNELK